MVCYFQEPNLRPHLLKDVFGFQPELAQLVDDVDPVAEAKVGEVDAVVEEGAALKVELELVFLGLLALGQEQAPQVRVVVLE